MQPVIASSLIMKRKKHSCLLLFVKELGDTYYPKGATDYPDKHRRRIALAAMNDIPVATFDFAMRNYRQMKGWEAKYVIRPKARQRRGGKKGSQEKKEQDPP